MSAWRTLGVVKPTELVDARLQLHHALQLVAAVGVTFLEPEPDDAHPNAGWHGALEALVGHRVPTRRPFRVGLRPGDAHLLLIDGDDARVIAALELSGRTYAEAHDWLGDVIGSRGVSVPPEGLDRSPYHLPQHPVAAGAEFRTEPAQAFAEVGNWMANAHDLLVELTDRDIRASAVRCWPHHFDVATLLAVGTAPDGTFVQSMGVGLSPGDESYSEPYAYVSPWPYPSQELLPRLTGGGRWHTELFTSAVLLGSELLDAGPPEAQRERLRRFLETTVNATREALS